MAIRIKKSKYDLYTLGTRVYSLLLVTEECSWWSDLNENVLGVVTYDVYDQDYSWVVLARDELGCFRAVDLDCSYPSERRAEAMVRTKIEDLSRSVKFQGFVPQYDAQRKPINLLSPIQDISKANLHPYFLHLIEDPGREPARRVIREIAPWLYPADSHFIKEFQCNQFDQRLWEIYLWATFRELGYDVAQHEAPDFECRSPLAHFTVEATTIAPSQKGVLADHPNPKLKEEFNDFLVTYMPMKFGSALCSKLDKVNAEGLHYWERSHSESKPFIIAIADFHKPGNHQKKESASITYSQSALYIYLYGHRVDWAFEDGKLLINVAPVKEHKYQSKIIPSGFFDLPKAENISAVLFSNAGTLAKFDRIGVAAGFGAKNHKYLRIGLKFDPNPNAVVGKSFVTDVEDDAYKECWSDEIQIFHNPNAKYPLAPEAFPGVAHHFWKNGKLVTFDYEERVLSSNTMIIHLTDE
ncbi:MAG: hypothetical protein NPIRA03_36680 [Nitrospirales bacterium]|nr:MAG: hypothetical protein NPIRA03_36680 [Nitrospirales bacterium]